MLIEQQASGVYYGSQWSNKTIDLWHSFKLLCSVLPTVRWQAAVFLNAHIVLALLLC